MKVSNSTISRKKFLHNAKTSSFRIDIDFDGCDVDMVYNEMRTRGVSTIVPSLIVDFEAKGGFGTKPKKFQLKGNKTPTEASVYFALCWLAGYVDRRNMCTTTNKWEKDYGADFITVTHPSGFTYATAPDVKTELEELGIKVSEWVGLMMGCCHLVCEVDVKDFSPELVEKANKIVFDVFKKFVRYYKQKKAA